MLNLAAGRLILSTASVLLFAAVAAAVVGPPTRLPARESEITVELRNGHRDMDISGTVGASNIQPSRLKGVQTAIDARFVYAISDNVSAYALLGASRLNLGSMDLGAGGIPSGQLDFRGRYGFLWGVGGNYSMQTLSSFPDLLVGASAEYRRFSSQIGGGDVAGDEFRFALKGSRDYDRLTPYGGVLFSVLRADYDGTTSLGQVARGKIQNDDYVGIFGGAEYAFSDRVKGRLEAELFSSTAVTVSMIYALGGPDRAMRRRAGETRTGDPIPAAVAPSASPASTTPRPDHSVTAVRPVTPHPLNDPRTAEDQIRLGDQASQLGQHADATMYYSRALAADPSSFRAAYNLATTRYLDRDYSGAREYYLYAIKINPNDAEAHLYLGFSHFRLGDRDAAARSWRRVLEIDPGNAVALNNLQALGR
jgi:tetratricopeptide (TPR) repeat protein